MAKSRWATSTRLAASLLRCDDHNTLAMLKRREGETLAQLLIRLDQAIAKAHNGDIFTDEINPPAKPLRR